MKIKENIRIAIFSIRTNILRSLLTMLGIIIGVAAVIAIITIGNGGRDYIVGMIRDMGQSTMNITARGRNITDSDMMTLADVEAIEQIESVAAVSPFITDFGKTESENYNGFGLMFCGNEQFLKVTGIEVIHGTFYTEEDVEVARNVCLLDTASAKAYFGYENPVGETIEITLNKQTRSFRIIGIINLQKLSGSSSIDLSELMGGEDMAPCMLTMPCTTYDAMRGRESRYDLIYLTAKEDDKLDEAGKTAVNTLYSRHNNHNSNNEVYQLTNMATFIDLLDSVIRIFTAFIASVSAISLVVGGIGVMNIMLVSVTERTREIGIRKALGAKTTTIMMQFLTESVIICAIGGTIGLILGVSGAMIAAAYVGVPIELKLSTVLIAVGFSSAIGIFFGIYPARRAAKMHPIEALRRD